MDTPAQIRASSPMCLDSRRAHGRAMARPPRRSNVTLRDSADGAEPGVALPYARAERPRPWSGVSAAGGRGGRSVAASEMPRGWDLGGSLRHLALFRSLGEYRDEATSLFYGLNNVLIRIELAAIF
jgi:hypothetical protein